MSTLPQPGVAARQARPSPLHLPSQASATKIALGYAAAGALWILGSGWLLDRLVDDPAIQAGLELIKGWLFVGATALLLWLVLDRYFRMIRRSGRILEDSETRWKQALEGASQAVWDWNVQGGEVLYSPEWKALLGYEIHEIGNTLSEWESRVHPEDRTRVMGELQCHLEGQSLLYLAEHRVRCKSGDYRWILSRGKVARRSPDGKPLRLVGTCSDIHRRKQAVEWNHIKHDLMQALAAATRLEDGLRLCLDAALKAEGFDSGGFYLVEERTGALNLTIHRGFSPTFASAVSRVEAGTSRADCVAEGQPVFATWKANPPVLTEPELQEGLRAVARIPVCFEGRPIGCLIVASHSRSEVPLVAREALETIAAGAAQAIVRLHAQEALRASEEKHRGIFDESVVAIYVFDQDKRFLDSNQAGLELLGYSREELLQLRMPDVDADPAVVLPAHEQLLTGGRLINYEHRLRRKDGSLVTVLNNSRPLTDVGGHVVGMQSTLVDITDYRHAQVALENSERLLRMALEVGKIGVFQADVATGQATWSSGVEEIWGLPAEFRGDFLQYCWDHLHPEDVHRVRDSYTRFLEQAGEQETDFRVVRPDGTVCWLRWRGRVIADAAGVARQVIGVNLDINERKRLEEDRETGLLKYRTLFDSLPIGVTLADRDGRLVESNRAAERLLGLSEDEQQHRTIDGREWRIVRPDGSPMPPVDFASVRALREQRLIENVEMGLVRSPTETVWISVTAVPVALPDIGVVIAYVDITSRKQAEQLLQERETRFRALIENAPDGVVLVSREGRMTYASPTACRMFGVDGARLHEVSPDASTHPDDLPRVLAALEQLLHSPEEVKTLQYRFRHANGSWIWIESVFTNLLDVPGVNAIVINFRNIHDRKRAEDALQERDALLREMGRVAKVGGWEFDAATGVGRWTEEVARIHDLPLDTQPTKTLGLSFYPGEAGERIRAAVASAVSQGIPYDLELEFVSAQGVRKWVHTIGQPVCQDGRVVKLRGAIQDITERKRAEAELAFEATRRRILIEGSRDGIVVLDQAGKVLEANRRFAEMLGYTAEEVRQLHVWDWDRDWSPERVLEAIRLLGPEGAQFETRHYRKDGSSFSVDLSNSTAELAGQKLVFCVCHDITERKRSEAALQESLLFRREAENIARIGAWKVSPETDYLYWTEGVREIIEVPRDYQPGLREGLQFYDAEAIPALQQALQAALKDGTPFRIETGVTTTSGRRRWTEVRGLKRVADGGQAFVMGTFQDITDRKRAEARAARDSLRTEFLLELHQRAPQLSDRELFDYVLDRAVRLTDSAIGFFHQVSEDQRTIILTTWNDAAQQSCTVPHETHYPVNEAGNWVDCIREQRPVIYNDYATSPHRHGLPTGHAPVSRFMTIPVVHEGRVRIIFGVGNKPADYDQDDIDQLQVVANELHKIMTQRAAQQQLRQLSRAVEQSTVSIVITDPQGAIEYVNPRFTEVSGYTLADVRGRNPRVLQSGETPPAMYERLWQTILAGQDWHGELHNRKQNGQLHWESVSISPITDNAGNVTHFVAVKEDITERKRAELDLRASEERYRSVLDAMTDSIHVAEHDQRLVLVNETCRQWCAKAGVEEPRPGEALRQALPFLPADAESTHSQTLATDAPVTLLRNKILIDGRELVVDIRHIPIREHGQPGRIMTVIRDVTEHAKLESQLLRAQRMESLGTMAAGIAHDLNNVLAPVMMSVPLIRDQVSDGETRNLLDSVEASVQRGADIIRQLLVFSRGVEGERRPLRLGDQVKELLKITREVFPRNLTIRNEIPRDLWPVSGNSTHLHQVLLNLSVNARDAMPLGGTLTFCGQNLIVDDSYGGPSPPPKPGPYVVLQVRDSGVGIPARLLDKIFDPFFTTKGIGEGTGLGLSTVQGIVCSHGGFIEVDSQEGLGTEFRVFLPAIQTGEVTPDAPPEEILARGSGQTILVVDDEPAVRSLLQKTLERFGYRVLCAGDGSEALAVYEAQRAQIAAVLTDLAMPVMNGLVLTLRLQQLNPRLPVLVTTGRADKEQRSALTAAGVKHLLDKPFRAAALLAALRESLTP